jgi:uncharacterized protein
MTKYLLLIALAVFVWWLLRQARPRSDDKQPPHVRHAAERMVKCAHCGINQPVSESLLANDRYYCSAAHRQAAETDAGDNEGSC